MREYASSTAQQYTVPSLVQCSVMSVTHNVFGRSARNRRFWENVVAGEQRTRTLEDLDLHDLDPVLPPQAHQLGAFLASQALFGAPVDVGLTDPVPQA